MAKVKFGAIVTEARGKLGGNVFSKNRGGAYMRAYTSTIASSTSYQVTVRNRLATLSADWRELTETQRNSWNLAVQDWLHTNVFGDIIRPSGFNLYMRLNANLVQVGESALAVPPSPGVVPGIFDISLTADSGASDILIDFDASALTSDFAIVLFATDALSAGINYVKNKLRIIATLDFDEASPYNAFTVWDTKYATLTAGARVSIAMQVVSKITGQKSILFPATTIVANTPQTDVVLYTTNVSNGGAYPSGWSQSNDDIIVDNTSALIPNSSGYTGASGSYKFVHDDTIGYGTVYLKYDNSLSTIGYDNIRLSFGNYDHVAGGLVEYSLDGTAWANCPGLGWGSEPWNLISAAMPVACANVANLRFRFSMPSDGFGDYKGLDDITIIGDAM